MKVGTPKKSQITLEASIVTVCVDLSKNTFHTSKKESFALFPLLRGSREKSIVVFGVPGFRHSWSKNGARWGFF